jgi:hypothetical protein
MFYWVLFMKSIEDFQGWNLTDQNVAGFPTAVKMVKEFLAAKNEGAKVKVLKEYLAEAVVDDETIFTGNYGTNKKILYLIGRYSGRDKKAVIRISYKDRHNKNHHLLSAGYWRSKMPTKVGKIALICLLFLFCISIIF